jgi:hypothetical protein
VFFETLETASIASAVEQLVTTAWNSDEIRAHARLFSEEAFAARLHAIVDEELQRG